MSALARLFGSSTWWSALLSIVATVIAKANGIDLDPIVTAAVPAAVGIKEAARHYGTGLAAAAAADAVVRRNAQRDAFEVGRFAPPV